VVVERVERLRQEYLDREIRDNSSRLSGYETDTDIYQRIESVLIEPTNFSVKDSVDDFFGAFDDLTLRPEDNDKRQIVLDKARTMTQRFQITGQRLQELRKDVGDRVENTLDDLNRKLDDVAELNERIFAAGITNSGDAAGFDDRRAKILEEISKYVDAQVTFTSDNQALVSVNGKTLVTGVTASKLQAKELTDEATGEKTLIVTVVNIAGQQLTQVKPRTGEFASLLKHYNTTLDEKESTNAFSAAKELDRLAASVVENVNAVTRRGYGLNDTGDTPPGRNFFSPATEDIPITTSTIQVNPDLIGNVRDIPTADVANEPGNNTIAREVAALTSDQEFIDSTTMWDFYNTFLATVGNAGAESLNGQQVTDLVNNQLSAQREAVNGVNLDEEAIGLVKFQRAFEASARVVNASDQFLQTIVNLGR
jgi:flagellar hook-associated protein 1 FlgK